MAVLSEFRRPPNTGFQPSPLGDRRTGAEPRAGQAHGARYFERARTKRATMLLRVLFPYPYAVEVSRLRQQLDQAHLAWAREWKDRQPDFQIENIRFVHDPLWNRRILSLQAAYDGEVWFWRATRVFATCAVGSI
ncbi:MAG: hypothetical protein WCA28_16530 [Bradyrhizobium sp.]